MSIACARRSFKKFIRWIYTPSQKKMVKESFAHSNLVENVESNSCKLKDFSENVERCHDSTLLLSDRMDYTLNELRDAVRCTRTFREKIEEPLQERMMHYDVTVIPNLQRKNEELKMQIENLNLKLDKMTVDETG